MCVNTIKIYDSIILLYSLVSVANIFIYLQRIRQSRSPNRLRTNRTINLSGILFYKRLSLRSCTSHSVLFCCQYYYISDEPSNSVFDVHISKATRRITIYRLLSHNYFIFYHGKIPRILVSKFVVNIYITIASRIENNLKLCVNFNICCYS